MDWVYGQAIGFLGNFFALMGNMGVELFELEWVSAIILFFSRLAWALFTVSVVVCAFECGIEYSTGRGNLQQCGMNIIKGFLAVSLFTVVPVRLYALSVSLQGTFSAGLTGYGRSIGEVGQDIITELSEIQTLSDVVNSSHFGLGIITSPIKIARVDFTLNGHEYTYEAAKLDGNFSRAEGDAVGSTALNAEYGATLDCLSPDTWRAHWNYNDISYYLSSFDRPSEENITEIAQELIAASCK